MYFYCYFIRDSCVIFFLIVQHTPRSTRTDNLFPYTTLFRSPAGVAEVAGAVAGPEEVEQKHVDAERGQGARLQRCHAPRAVHLLGEGWQIHQAEALSDRKSTRLNSSH